MVLGKLEKPALVFWFHFLFRNRQIENIATGQRMQRRMKVGIGLEAWLFVKEVYDTRRLRSSPGNRFRYQLLITGVVENSTIPNRSGA